ncbi:flagellar basal-body MS-ring/collar protein FliF [Acetomicrobium sp.]|jgi:flagellar M-ring protein FliF|uniref:flagellar basal-body MS-ring/collar protein FliF n=1 Tax=Acetomicrobium sp. TaxID=1872099 RepID=UPI003D97D689
MVDRIAKTWNDIKQFWAGLSKRQRLSIIGVAVAGLLVIVFILWSSGRREYEPLFSNLDIDDQAAIVSYLKENNIPYKVDPSFNAILVPKDVVYEARLSLVGEGLPKGGVVGFELFDKAKMGMTDFQQKIGYLRALEGELTRTIQAIRGVQSCKVNIVIPEKRLFLEEQFPATASVLLDLKPGFEMGPEQVKAILHLVSHSVEGLSPDNVVVVDSKGKILSDDVLDESFFVAGGDTITSIQREMERQQELEMERKARLMLERIFGPGKAVVRVRVFLDFDKKRTSVKEYIPGPSGKGVPRSAQNVEEMYTGPGVPPGGAPGTTTNIPGYVITPEASGPSSYERTEGITNYEISTREQEVVYTPGAVKKITASVLIDGQLAQEVMDELRRAVAAALGINEARGDELYLVSMPFSPLEMPTVSIKKLGLLPLIALIGLVTALVAGVFVLWRRKKVPKRIEEFPKPKEEEIPSLEELLKHPELLKERGELAILEHQLREYGSKKPEEIAAIIKNWLLEDQY